MTKEQRLVLLHQIEEQIYVCSLESTLQDDLKSIAIHSIIEEETERIYKKESEEQEPCEEYVSRDAVEDAIAEYEVYGERIGYTVACDIVSDLPLVTLQPEIGHWIGIDEEPHEDYECDRCGYVVSTYTANITPHTEYKYCPNCGAKMEAESEAEE